MAFRPVLRHGIRTGQRSKKGEMTMAKGNAWEFQMDLAKDALRLLEEEQAALEIRCPGKYHGFESHPLRQRSAESVRPETF